MDKWAAAREILEENHVYVEQSDPNLDCSIPAPSDWHEMKRRLLQPIPQTVYDSRPSYEEFRRDNSDAGSESAVRMISNRILPKPWPSYWDNRCEIQFTNMSQSKPFGKDLPRPKPDIHDGSSRMDALIRVRKNLRSYIVPKSDAATVLPNLVVELKGPKKDDVKALQQAAYSGALCARGIQATIEHTQHFGELLQINSRQEDRRQDMKTRSIAMTYSHGCLTVYLVHARPIESHRHTLEQWHLDNALEDCHYHVTHLAQVLLSSTREEYQRGIRILQNVYDWCKEQREAVIKDANRVAELQEAKEAEIKDANRVAKLQEATDAKQTRKVFSPLQVVLRQNKKPLSKTRAENIESPSSHRQNGRRLDGVRTGTAATPTRITPQPSTSGERSMLSSNGKVCMESQSNPQGVTAACGLSRQFAKFQPGEPIDLTESFDDSERAVETKSLREADDSRETLAQTSLPSETLLSLPESQIGALSSLAKSRRSPKASTHDIDITLTDQSLIGRPDSPLEEPSTRPRNQSEVQLLLGIRQHAHEVRSSSPHTQAQVSDALSITSTQNSLSVSRSPKRVQQDDHLQTPPKRSKTDHQLSERPTKQKAAQQTPGPITAMKERRHRLSERIQPVITTSQESTVYDIYEDFDSPPKRVRPLPSLDCTQSLKASGPTCRPPSPQTAISISSHAASESSSPLVECSQWISRPDQIDEVESAFGADVSWALNALDVSHDMTQTLTATTQKQLFSTENTQHHRSMSLHEVEGRDRQTVELRPSHDPVATPTSVQTESDISPCRPSSDRFKAVKLGCLIARSTPWQQLDRNRVSASTNLQAQSFSEEAGGELNSRYNEAMLGSTSNHNQGNFSATSGPLLPTSRQDGGYGATDGTATALSAQTSPNGETCKHLQASPGFGKRLMDEAAARIKARRRQDMQDGST